MKKLLTLGTDVFLFTFLVVILIMPLLVSFNLDPQLYEAVRSHVAGVQTISSEENNGMIFEDANTTSMRIRREKGKHGTNAYILDYSLIAGSPFDETILLGTASNPAQENVTYVVNIYGAREGLADMRIFLVADEEQFVLFDGIDFHEAIVSVEALSQKDFSLNIRSDVSVYFAQRLRLEIRGSD